MKTVNTGALLQADSTMPDQAGFPAQVSRCQALGSPAAPLPPEPAQGQPHRAQKSSRQLADWDVPVHQILQQLFSTEAKKQ